MPSIPIDRRVATAADLARIDAPPGSLVWVGNAGRFYRATLRDSIGISGADEDQIPISWLPEVDESVLFTAAGDGSDDWARLVALVAIEYGVGGRRRKIVFARGNYRCATTLIMPVGFQAELMPGCDIAVDLNPRPLPVPPYAGPFVANLVAAGSAVLTSAAVVGETILYTSTAPVVGQTLLVCRSGGYPAEPFEVISVTGAASPYTVEVDHEVTYAYPISAPITYVTPNTYISVIGNGCTVHGPTERMLSIACGKHCLFDGFDLDVSQTTEFCVSHDTGSMHSTHRNLTVRNSQSAALYVESAYNCLVDSCTGVDCLQGFGLWGTRHRIINCKAKGTNISTGQMTWGISLGTPGFNTDNGATQLCSVEHCDVSYFRIGLLSVGTRKCNVVNSKFNACDQGVVANINESTPTVDLELENCTIERCEHEGVYVYGNCNITLNDCSVLDNGKAASGNRDAVYTAAGAYVAVHGGRYRRVANNHYLVFQTSGRLSIDGYATIDANSGDYAIMNNTGSVVEVNGLRVTGNPAFVFNSVGALRYSNIVLTGTPQYGIASGGASWRGVNASLSGATTAVYAGSTGLSWGTTVLNGATPVAIPFTAITAANRVRGVRSASAGTPGHWTLAVNVGVGLTLTGTAGDTSTIAWEID